MRDIRKMLGLPFTWPDTLRLTESRSPKPEPSVHTIRVEEYDPGTRTQAEPPIKTEPLEPNEVPVRVTNVPPDVGPGKISNRNIQSKKKQTPVSGLTLEIDGGE